MTNSSVITEYIIKSTRIKSKDPKYLNVVHYFGGFIDLGMLGQSEHWVYENEAKLFGINEANQFLKYFIKRDRGNSYQFEILVNKK
jgi:hypothetical protein